MHICIYIYNIQRIYLIIVIFIHFRNKATYISHKTVGLGGRGWNQPVLLCAQETAVKCEVGKSITTLRCDYRELPGKLMEKEMTRWLDCLPRCSWWVLPATELLGLPWKKHWDFLALFFLKLANGCKWSIWGGHMSCIFQLRGWYHHYPFQ